MLPYEDKVADLFHALHSAQVQDSVDQFASLPQANQYRKLYAMVARHVGPGAPVLDWGCGNGHFSLFLAREGLRVTSYSFEEEPAVFRLLRGPGGSPVNFVSGSTADPRRLPFPDSSFDCVFSVGVLEHVRETGGTEADSLREIRRVLRPGGKFICYHFPNAYSWIEALNRALYGARAGAREQSKYFHPYLFTKGAIRALCDETGLSLLEIERYGALPRNVMRRLPAALRASRPLATAVNLCDLVLEKAVSPLAQSYAFVAQRPA